MHIISGKYKKRVLVAPKSDQVRPTTSQLREAVFNICQLTIEGAYFLDLFAGSGAMGLEALSRGARHATLVDQGRPALVALRHNIVALHVENETSVLGLDVFKALHQLVRQGRCFDVIYVDPPYGAGLSAPVLAYLDAHPLLRPEGSLFIEDADLTPPPLTRLRLHSKRSIGRAHLYEYHLL